MTHHHHMSGQVDWIIVGMRGDDAASGRTVMASNSVAEICFDIEYDAGPEYDDGLVRYKGEDKVDHIEIMVRTRRGSDPHYAMAVGRDYADAIKNLMTYWKREAS